MLPKSSLSRIRGQKISTRSLYLDSASRSWDQNRAPVPERPAVCVGCGHQHKGRHHTEPLLRVVFVFCFFSLFLGKVRGKTPRTAVFLPCCFCNLFVIFIVHRLLCAFPKLGELLRLPCLPFSLPRETNPKKNPVDGCEIQFAAPRKEAPGMI